MGQNQTPCFCVSTVCPQILNLIPFVVNTESLDLIRKLLLTSTVLLVAPGTKWQLWFGVVVSASTSLIYLKLEPYRNNFCGILQMATILQIM